MVFLSARPGEEHHELLLMPGRTGDGDVKVVQQVSFHVDSVEDVREFHHRFVEDGVQIDSVVTHGNTASVYFRDPEDNRLEIYYSLPVEWPQPFRAEIDVTQSADGILKQIHDVTVARSARGRRRQYPHLTLPFRERDATRRRGTMTTEVCGATGNRRAGLHKEGEGGGTSYTVRLATAGRSQRSEGIPVSRAWGCATRASCRAPSGMRVGGKGHVTR